MKAGVLVEAGRIEIQDVELPVIQSNQILVKVKNCGICTLEQRLYRGDMKIYYPIVPGHEASGVVAEVGTEVFGDVKKGDRVALDLVLRCGECFYCRTGHSNLCQNRFTKGVRILGGFGEYLAVRATQVYKIPDSVSFREAAFTEPVACCIRSLKKINLSLAEDVLILGAGPMGLMHLQVARAMGARVFVSDPDTKRLEKAVSLGAALTIDPVHQDLNEVVMEITGGKGVDAGVITTPAHSALGGALGALSKSGRINIYTSYGDEPEFPVDANTLHRNEYLITGSEGRIEYDFYQAVRLIAFGTVDVTTLISKAVGFDGLEEGIKDAMSSDTYRVLMEHEAN